jgi:hypothetical protein
MRKIAGIIIVWYSFFGAGFSYFCDWVLTFEEYQVIAENDIVGQIKDVSINIHTSWEKPLIDSWYPVSLSYDTIYTIDVKEVTRWEWQTWSITLTTDWQNRRVSNTFWVSCPDLIYWATYRFLDQVNDWLDIRWGCRCNYELIHPEVVWSNSLSSAESEFIQTYIKDRAVDKTVEDRANAVNAVITTHAHVLNTSPELYRIIHILQTIRDTLMWLWW